MAPKEKMVSIQEPEVVTPVPVGTPCQALVEIAGPSQRDGKMQCLPASLKAPHTSSRFKKPTKAKARVKALPPKIPRTPLPLALLMQALKMQRAAPSPPIGSSESSAQVAAQTAWLESVPDPWKELDENAVLLKTDDEDWDPVELLSYSDPTEAAEAAAQVDAVAKTAAINETCLHIRACRGYFEKLQVSQAVEARTVSLDFSYNCLTRIDALPPLWLRRLRVCRNPLLSLDGMGNLFPRLLVLDISFTDLSLIPCAWKALRRCFHLRRLTAESAGIFSVAEMEKMPSLKCLELPHNGIDLLVDLATIAKNCAHLTRLDLRGNPVTSEFGYMDSVMRNFPRLKWHNNTKRARFVGPAVSMNEVAALQTEIFNIHKLSEWRTDNDSVNDGGSGESAMHTSFTTTYKYLPAKMDGNILGGLTNRVQGTDLLSPVNPRTHPKQHIDLNRFDLNWQNSDEWDGCDCLPSWGLLGVDDDEETDDENNGSSGAWKSLAFAEEHEETEDESHIGLSPHADVESESSDENARFAGGFPSDGGDSGSSELSTPRPGDDRSSSSADDYLGQGEKGSERTATPTQTGQHLTEGSFETQMLFETPANQQIPLSSPDARLSGSSGRASPMERQQISSPESHMTPKTKERASQGEEDEYAGEDDWEEDTEPTATTDV